MRIFKVFATTLCALVLGTVMVTGAKADQFDKKTTVTFNNPVEIPGQVLEPGTYVFKMLDSQFVRNVVQVWNEGEDQLIATIHTDSDYRPHADGRSVFVLDQSSGGPTAALQSWFFAGDTSGEQFVYPEYPTTQEASNMDVAH
jgi:hypothetical protein